MKKKKKKAVVQNKKYAVLFQFIYCLPCIVYGAIVILVVRARLCENLTYGEYWSYNSERLWDLSAWWKSRIVVLSTIVAFCILILRIFTKSLKIKKTILYVPMAVYFITIILSFAFSRYKNISWSGDNNRYEGTYILVCYVFMLFYTINTIENKQMLKIIFYSVVISLLLLQIIGIAQLTGHNPYQTVIGQKMVMPNYLNQETGYTMWQEIDALAKQTPPRTLLVNPQKNVYQTVYSFNYVSFYLSAVIPVFVMLFILCSGIKEKIAMAVMVTLAFINIWAANASGGYLGLFVAFIAAIITFWKFIIKWRYQLLIIIVLAGISAVLTNRYIEHAGLGSLVGQVSRQIAADVPIMSTTPTTSTASTPSTESTESAESTESTMETKDRIDYFINNEDSIVVSVNNNRLNIKVNSDTSHVVEYITDDQDTILEVKYVNGVLQSEGNEYRLLALNLVDDRFSNLDIYIPEITWYAEGTKMCIIKLKNEEKTWQFLVSQGGTYYQTEDGALVKLRNVPHWGFENNQWFGTGRGYIWSRIFPLMLETLILGYGADTFIMHFPHDDFTGLYYDYGVNFILVDKPHNFILQSFVNTGGISTIALLAIIGIYLIQSFRLYSKSMQYDIFSRIGAGIYLGIIAFLAAGIAYDSSVNVMPLIYSLLGIGISCNYFVKANLNID